MNPTVISPLKTSLMLVAFITLGCQMPVNHITGTNVSLVKGLTVCWSAPSTSARTIMPSTFPIPATYNVTLQPTSGNPVSQTGLTSTSWTFQNLLPSAYTVAVVGLDGSGNAIVQGTSGVDTTTNSSATVAVTLNYALTGTGTGQVNLTLNLASAGVSSTTATVKLVDPLGNVTSPTLGISGSNYTYVDPTASAGSWKAFFMIKSSTQTALKMESLLVFQNVSTIATLNFLSTDFNATYVPVTGVSLGQSSLNVPVATSQTLSATIAPANASNQLVSWTTSNAGVATVSQAGLVTGVGSGSATITATSVDNPAQKATCAVSVGYSVTYNANGALGGTVPIDGTLYQTGQTVTLAPNAGQLSGGFFAGWSTSVGGTAVGTTYTIGTTNVTFYAIWVQLAQWAQTTQIAVSGSVGLYAVTLDASGNTYAVGSIGTNSYGYSFGNGVTATVTSASLNSLIVKYNSSGLAQWAQPLTFGTGFAQFEGVTIDSSGNTYAVGQINGVGSYGFGNGITCTGTSTGSNTVIVEYNSSGLAQWAQTLTSGTGYASFNGVTIDGSGNTYAVGSIGTGSFGFGNGITTTGTSSSSSPLIVKYNNAGVAQWAQTLSDGSGNASFSGVAIDGSGNTYALGSIGAGSFGFGNGVTATGTSGTNSVIVKYNSSGVAQWAQVMNAVTAVALTIDSSGNTYAVGGVAGTASYAFGNGVTVTGTGAFNPLLVKYNSSGSAQWAQTLTSGTGYAQFNGVTIDSSGNTYAVGSIGSGVFGFGNGVTAGGTISTNSLIIKYNSSGVAQWSQTLTSSSAGAAFNGVTVDGSGNTYAVGTLAGTGSFGNGVTVSGPYWSGNDSLIVKYLAH